MEGACLPLPHCSYPLLWTYWNLLCWVTPRAYAANSTFKDMNWWRQEHAYYILPPSTCIANFLITLNRSKHLINFVNMEKPDRMFYIHLLTNSHQCQIQQQVQWIHRGWWWHETTLLEHTAPHQHVVHTQLAKHTQYTVHHTSTLLVVVVHYKV